MKLAITGRDWLGRMYVYAGNDIELGPFWSRDRAFDAWAAVQTAYNEGVSQGRIEAGADWYEGFRAGRNAERPNRDRKGQFLPKPKRD